jgi:cytochrome c551/c552
MSAARSIVSRLPRIMLVLALTGAAAGVVAAEAPGAQLFEQKRCYICHETDKVSLGPPLKAIAVRHRARRDVMSEVLARKIVHGGGGNWGLVPMVPNQWVSSWACSRRRAQPHRAARRAGGGAAYSFATQAANSARWASLTPGVAFFALTQPVIEVFSTSAYDGEDFSSEA